jgi:uncharacterized protein (DUF58 family)
MLFDSNPNPAAGLGKPGKKDRVTCFPTRYGGLFIVALVGMLIGSVNYNNNLGFLFTFLLGSMLLISLVHSYRNVQGIRVDKIHALPVFEAQEAVFELKLRMLPPRQRMTVRFRLDDSKEVMVDRMSGSRVRVSVALPARKRGRVSPRTLTIISEYPFGLFGFRAACQIFADCLVYPKPVPVQKMSMQDLFQAHSAEGVAVDSLEDFKGLRAFQNGDATQHIFWKAFSKGQGLMVKEFLGGASPRLCFSWNKINQADVEKKLSMLCAMVLKAHGMKLTYGIRLPGQLITPDKGEHHKLACLRALALFP